MPSQPFFSICIPVYKNVQFLKRLLDSIFEQSFTDFEIVITDDSPDHAVGEWIAEHYASEKIKYFKNPLALGTPENWNEAIRNANGAWIKLMHDDDWFATADSLKYFYDATVSGETDFYFSGYKNVYVNDNNRQVEFKFSYSRWQRIKKYPPNICAGNIIGAPSTVLVKRELGELYDNRMKWLVDIDYYIRLMNKSKPVYIPFPLVYVGQSNLQVTKFTQNKPEVEIPEGLLLQSKLGDTALRHIMYYDVWWRLIRNLNIRTIDELRNFAPNQAVAKAITRIIAFQKLLPSRLLKIGIISKLLMTLSWSYNRLID